MTDEPRGLIGGCGCLVLIAWLAFLAGMTAGHFI